MTTRMMLGLTFLGSVAVGLLMLAFTVPSGPRNETTKEIGAIFDPANSQIAPASFVPAVSRAQVIARVREKLPSFFETVDPNAFQVQATVALYSGKHERTGESLAGREVWVVVVDNLPIGGASGGPQGADRLMRGERPVNQLVVVYDAQTGEQIDGAIMGRWELPTSK
ncbi:MAG: hypothetical protein HYU30_07165 [Chloroflexi bacterium]|nr:hypothetical protein [Chloroflexota bacterium]